MPSPDRLEREFTLRTAVARYDQLRSRDALASTAAEMIDDDPAHHVGLGSGVAPLAKEEALEMLALSEVITRKASYGRQLGVRSARAAGASWSQIGEAVGTSKQSAWEAHIRWIDEHDATAARTLAGESDDEV